MLIGSVLSAQAGPKGIAVVIAPEQASGICFSENADKGFACARKKCVAGGASNRDCLRVKWCYPAGWSADIFVQHQEGPHWHEFLCGWPDRKSVEKAAQVRCGNGKREFIIECATVQLWTPDGEKLEFDPQ